jgi:hypothetical protein
MRIGIVTVCVTDQDAARASYTEKLGSCLGTTPVRRLPVAHRALAGTT